MQDYRKISNKEFIENFGYILKTIPLGEVAELVEYSLSLKNNYLLDKLASDFNFCCRRVKRANLGELLKSFSKEKKFHNLIAETFDLYKDKILVFNVLDILKVIFEIGRIDIIETNMALILENANNEEIYQNIINYLVDIPNCQKMLDDLSNIYANLPEELGFLKSINTGTFINIYYNDYLNEVIDIFKKYSNNKISSIKHLGNGFTSSIFLVDTTEKLIIKIGRKRVHFKSKFSKYLLQPHLRKEYVKDGKVIFTLEIQDYCDIDNINKEDANKLHELLKAEGSVWLDKNETNVFRLLKPNTRKLKPLEDGYNYEGLTDYETFGNIGDLIIGDTDWVFTTEENCNRKKQYDLVSDRVVLSILFKQDINIENFKKIFNQTYNHYEILVNNFELKKLDSRIKLSNNIKGVFILEINDISMLKDPYFIEKVLIKGIMKTNMYELREGAR